MRKRIPARSLSFWQTPEPDTSGSQGIRSNRSVTYYWSVSQAIKAGGFLQEGNRVAQMPALFRNADPHGRFEEPGRRAVQQSGNHHQLTEHLRDFSWFRVGQILSS